MDEMILLEECPICRGAGMLMHEGGWNVQVECADLWTRAVLRAKSFSGFIRSISSEPFHKQTDLCEKEKIKWQTSTGIRVT